MRKLDQTRDLLRNLRNCITQAQNLAFLKLELQGPVQEFLGHEQLEQIASLKRTLAFLERTVYLEHQRIRPEASKNPSGKTSRIRRRKVKFSLSY